MLVLVEHTMVTIHLVLVILVVAAVIVMQAGLQIAKALASLTTSTKHGWVMGTVMMVLTSQPIMVVMNAQQVLLSG